MTASPYKPTIGAISEGTLRTADLMHAFARELRRFDESSTLVQEADAAETLNSCGWNNLMDSEEASELVSALQNALEERAPDYMTFGTLEGDGACFGWWACVETALEDLPHVDAGDEPPEGVASYVSITDHGNVTCYVNGVEVWSVV